MNQDNETQASQKQNAYGKRLNTPRDDKTKRCKSGMK